MLNHSSATPHTIKSTTNTSLTTNGTSTTNTISDALRRRARAVIINKTVDARTRAVIRYGLETNDPWLPELVRRVNAGEAIVDDMNFLPPSETSQEDLSDGTIEAPAEKLEALAEMICQAGDEPSAALLVLMSMLEKSTHPKALANLTKHFVFSRYGELNVNGMVDTQIAVLEGQLLRGLGLPECGKY